ncbi:Unknown protein sequence [Pseudomonas syringae pv. syringae]|nr:Unknown protein sequence [Pseudomonas syringae pv. aceris]KPB16470.1 Unknown protein sequence [Pseudomonas syringae pv. syringae]RMT39086.1 hypothetical protein ALP49_101882 [Pseudomonas syringae pv. solidagae]
MKGEPHHAANAKHDLSKRLLPGRSNVRKARLSGRLHGDVRA